MSSSAARKGLSLLEVVLALAILAVASAYLAQSMQLATTNAIKSQQLNQAELVVESVLNQIIAGLIPPDNVTWTPYNSSQGATDWVYQIQQVPTEVAGMIGLQVAVQRVDPQMGVVPSDADMFVNRWIIDPSLGLDSPPEEETEAEAGTGGGI